VKKTRQNREIVDNFRMAEQAVPARGGKHGQAKRAPSGHAGAASNESSNLSKRASP
jgi:hypothetical protein